MFQTGLRKARGGMVSSIANLTERRSACFLLVPLIHFWKEQFCKNAKRRLRSLACLIFLTLQYFINIVLLTKFHLFTRNTVKSTTKHIHDRTAMTNAQSHDASSNQPMQITNIHLEQQQVKKACKERIQTLAKQNESTRHVLGAIVLVASRMSPSQFFQLLEREQSNWDLDDLKSIATALYDRLQILKEKQQELFPTVKMVESTLEKLYSYVMLDPNADKKIVLQVIHELHTELTALAGLLEKAENVNGQQQQPETEINRPEKQQLHRLVFNLEETTYKMALMTGIC